MYFYDLNLEPLVQGHLGLRELLQSYTQNFIQAFEPSDSKEEYFWFFFQVFQWFNLGHCGKGHFGPWDLCLKNLVKGHQAILHTKFQTSEPRRSGEEDFKVFFIFEHKIPHHRAILDPRATIWANWAKWFWRRFFFFIFYVFLWCEPQTPGTRLSSTLGSSFEQTW